MIATTRAPSSRDDSHRGAAETRGRFFRLAGTFSLAAAFFGGCIGDAGIPFVEGGDAGADAGADAAGAEIPRDGGPEAGKEAGPEIVPDSPPAEMGDLVKEGEIVFFTIGGKGGCAACHGATAMGELGIGPYIVGKTREQVAWCLENVDAMEWLRPIVTEHDIDAVAAYLQSLKK